ncbi:predicted protein [Naegleria gruberi]|uniref:5'-3' exoribonuclease 2 n=1 Tax=Naegleria gruberi TaxID=5762 RepID=D2VW45_NAEGR|nr:uncharacterized protein NAEGRDRAFT_81445 [Naegleria gruberi]EFC39014.1 predicted protein [Naegleria gruberi]|eukprot:XP_002671758.1 predicted protein [Naegleria gruberi strain NEG-M]
MGVPRLFKWLSERYPCIASSLTEATIPTVDNLYLDMNGIIHNCTHKDDELKAQLTEKEMILKIFRYIDQLFQLIKPSKHFFLALDGVAPRAKMNQQRSRRFRKVFDEQQLRKKLEQKGEKVPERDNLFDSNCITPGTEFMAKLSMHLKYFIHSKMQTDIKWQQCKVILSGHEVPGEGEHKIMNFIRGRKMEAGYQPNERHCLYGLDADLICLGLVTHEPHFMLLREDVFEQYRNNDSKEKSSNKPFAEKFHLLHLCALRQYLDFEFRQALLEQKLSFEYDLERIIDDFVFFIFFTGNDFLPHMPTLDIKEGSINTMIDIYKQILPKSGYLTELGDVHLERVQDFVRALASQESSMMEQRYTARLRENRKTRRRRGAKQVVDSEGFKSVGNSVNHPQTEATVENASSVLDSFANELSPGSLKKHLLQQEELFVNDGDHTEKDMGLVVGMSSVMDFNAPATVNYGVDADEDLEDEEGVEVEEVNDLLLKSIGDNGFDFNEQVIELPKYEKFLPKLCDGVKIGKHNLEGFPVLDCKTTQVEEKDVGIALFGHPSKKPSLVINMNPQYSRDQMMDDEFVIEESVKAAQGLSKYIGKKVYIGYPYPRLGILSSIADERASYFENSEPEYHNERDAEMFRKEYSYHKNVLLRRYGLDIGNVKVLLFVKLFKGMKRDKFGIKKSFHRDEFAYPHSLIVLPDDYEPTPDSKFAETGPQAVEKEYPVNSTVLVLGDQSYASLGKVAGYDKKFLKVSLTTPYSDQTPRPKFPKEAVTEFAAEKYVPLHIASKRLGLTKKALGLLIGSIRLELSNTKLTPNVGLGLRSKKSSKRIVGYCKCDFNEQNLDDSYFLNFDGGSLFTKPLSNKFSVGGTFGDWELSDKAMTLIGNFCQAFPDFVAKLEQDIPFRCELFFPNTLKDNHEKDKYYQTKVAEITKWIDEQGFRSLPFVDIEQDVLPVSALKAIEEAAIEFSKQPAQTPALQSIVIDPVFVHKPEDPCPNLFYIADFALGHRVMQMSGSGSARFGLVGTLVGIDGDNGQVIFDEEFVGGSTFGSRLSTARGAIVSLRSLVNLDKKKYIRVYDNEQKKYSYKQNVDYTKEHYFTTSSYNYDMPKVQNNQKQPASPQTQQPNNQRPQQPYKQRQFQPNNNNKNTNNGSSFKILNSNEANNANEHPFNFGKNGKPKHEKRRLQQNESQQVQQEGSSQQVQQETKTQEASSSSSTASTSSEDYNPSELFKQSRAKHRQNRVQKQTTTEDSAHDYLNMLQTQYKK